MKLVNLKQRRPLFLLGVNLFGMAFALLSPCDDELVRDALARVSDESDELGTFI